MTGKKISEYVDLAISSTQKKFIRRARNHRMATFFIEHLVQVTAFVQSNRQNS